MKRTQLWLLGLLVFLAGSTGLALAQNYDPAAETASLLNMRFYPTNGGFLVEELQLVFPPIDAQSLELTVFKRGGDQVASVPLRVEPMDKYPAFALMLPHGTPGNVRIGQPGSYVMSVSHGNQVIGQINFELKAEGGDDPFNPGRTFTRSGDWSRLGYLSANVERPNDAMRFHFWISTRELPGAPKSQQCTLHLMRGGTEVATTRSTFSVHSADWQYAAPQLFVPKASGAGPFTKAMLTAQDGRYTIVVKTKDGQKVKSYSLRVKNGAIVPHKRSQLGYKPHKEFLSPRLVDTSSGSGSRYRMLEVVWVEREN